METPIYIDDLISGVQIPEDENILGTNDPEEIRKILKDYGLHSNASQLEIYLAIKTRIFSGYVRPQEIIDFEMKVEDGELRIYKYQRQEKRHENILAAMELFGLNQRFSNIRELRWAIQCRHPELAQISGYNFTGVPGQIEVLGKDEEGTAVSITIDLPNKKPEEIATPIIESTQQELEELKLSI